jgi:hypothetical protein
LGNQPSPPILIEGEDKGGWLIGTKNHPMKFLVDSLAIHDAFSRLGDGADEWLASIGRIVRGSSDRELGKLEGALDALRKTVTGGTISSTPEENRGSALREPLRTDWFVRLREPRVTGHTRRLPLGREEIASTASGSLGSLVALRWLASFRLGVDAQLAAVHLELDASLRHDAASPASRCDIDAFYGGLETRTRTHAGACGLAQSPTPWRTGFAARRQGDVTRSRVGDRPIRARPIVVAPITQ